VPLAALTALGVTGALLIWDLEHPMRFFMIFTRPHWKSWLVRGAFVIAAYSLILVAHLGAGLGGGTSGASASRWIAWPGAPIAAMTAVYTAYLFAQSKARDLWQNPLLPPHFLVQAVFAGGATLLLLEAAGLGAFQGAAMLVGIAGAVHLLLVLGEFTLTHSTAHARLAAHQMVAGRYAVWFWSGIVGVAAAAGLALAAPAGWSWTGAAAGAVGIVGLYAHEHAHVQAAQSVPLA
ncbi:MAG: polysulfide reductase NrfD, partial [Myxococcales bacterium]|nr:polysulfide reductase NrfD [Myxococcales bacterium]